MCTPFIFYYFYVPPLFSIIFISSPFFYSFIFGLLLLVLAFAAQMTSKKAFILLKGSYLAKGQLKSSYPAK